jgi:hypothetical protein
VRHAKIQILGLIRYLRPDHNPLRRPLDRVHSRVVIAIIASFLVAGPLAAATVADVTYGVGVRAERRQADTRDQIYATVLSTSSVVSRSGADQTTQVRWRDATGNLRFGVASRRSGDRAGARRKIWLDQAGRATTRPRTRTQTVAEAALASFGSLGALCLLLAAAYALIDHRLDHRRFAVWEREWTTIAPRWTGRP